MAFMSGLAGLGNVPTGFLDTLSKMNQNDLDQQKLQMLKQDQSYTGLAGDALRLLGGGQQGGAAPGGQAQQPSQPVPSPAPPAGQQDYTGVGPSPIGAVAVPSGPSPAGRRATMPPEADPNNPNNWGAYQVEGGPSGTVQQPQPRQNATDLSSQLSGGALVPGQTVQTQSYPASATPSGPASASAGPPGGAPAGPSGGAFPAGGGAGGQRAPGVPQSAGGLTLERAIQAVVQAARARGQQVSPDMIYGAVSKLLPLLNNEDKMRFQLALQEYKSQAQLDMLNRRLDTMERIATGHDVTRRDVVGEQQKGAGERTDKIVTGRHEDVQMRSDTAIEIADKKINAAMERLKVSADTKMQIAKLNADEKTFLAAFIESQKNQRLTETDRAKFRNLNLTLDARKEIAAAAQAGATSRAVMQESGRESRFGRSETRKTGQAQDSLDFRKGQQEDLRQFHQSVLEQRERSMQAPGKGAASQLMDRYFKEHPNATLEDYQKFVQTGRSPTAAEAREQTQERLASSVETQIDSVLRDVEESGKGGPWVTGIAGDFTRATEIAGNISGFSDRATALAFGGKIELLRSMAPRLLINTARLSNKERDAWTAITRGLGLGSTRQDTREALLYLKQVVHQVYPGSKSTYQTPKPTPKPGEIHDFGGVKYKLKDDPSLDPFDPASWDKQGARSTTSRTRIAMGDNDEGGDEGPGEPKDLKPPPSVWNWLNTDAPPGLKEFLINNGQIKPPDKKKRSESSGQRSYA